MKTAFGEIDDSWEAVIGDSGSMLMLDTIKEVCGGTDADVLVNLRSVSLNNLKVVVIVERKWGPFMDACRFDSTLPPDSVTRVAKLLGKYPRTDKWAEQGILALSYPMFAPEGEHVKFRSVWEGWIRQLLKGLSERKKTNKYAFVLMGRAVRKLKSSITMMMPVVEHADPSNWDYAREGECAFTAIQKKAKLEISW